MLIIFIDEEEEEEEEEERKKKKEEKEMEDEEKTLPVQSLNMVQLTSIISLCNRHKTLRAKCRVLNAKTAENNHSVLEG